MGASFAAQTFAAATAVVVVFQLALMLGAPWGILAMGGRYPGEFPLPMRIAALVQALILIVLALVVLIRGRVIAPSLYSSSEAAIWVVVVLMGLSLIMHMFTPSKWERVVWAPVVAVLLTCSLVVARS